MSTPSLITHLGQCGIACVLLALAGHAAAQNIYKCTRAGQVVYTDQPCPDEHGTLLHQADAGDVIDRYLRLGQVAQAERYAQSRHLEALYQQRLAAYRESVQQRDDLQAQARAAAQQREDEASARALAAQAADQERLRAENDALRQQNAQYENQLNQPTYAPPPTYWNPAPPYVERPRWHPHRPSRDEPIFHPCEQLAGGRVKC